MKNKSFFLGSTCKIFLIANIFLLSCSQLLEVDLSYEDVEILGTNEMIFPTTDVQFLWEPVFGADNYSIQIVRPSFDAINSIVLDTLVEENSIKIRLHNYGDFALRVKAINSYSNTDFSNISFVVDSTYVYYDGH